MKNVGQFLHGTLLAAVLCLLAGLNSFAQIPDVPGAGTARGAEREISAAPEVPGTRYAFLIGINKYVNLNPLQHCADDVDLLRDTLVEHGGYDRSHINVVTDADVPTRFMILSKLKLFIAQASANDTVLIAFAGHGAVDSGGKSYLMTVDSSSSSDEALQEGAVSVEKINELLEKSPARQKILIIDACHSGGRDPSGKTAELKFSPLNVPEGKGIIELLSCDASEVSWESPKLGHGYFTYYLCKAIASEARADAHGIVTVDDVYKSTYDSVRREVQAEHNVRQTPLKRGAVLGSISLATRGRQTLKPPPAAELLRQLSGQVEMGVIAKPTLTAIEAVLVGSDDFGPAYRVRLLSTLLANGTLGETDYLKLAHTPLLQTSSHRTGASALDARTLRAVLVGIDKYQDFSLTGCVKEVRAIREILTQQGNPQRAEIQMLTDAQATGEAVMNALDKAARDSKPGDVVLLWFSSTGITVDATMDDTTRVQIEASGAPPASQPLIEHRGVVKSVPLQSQSGWLMAGSSKNHSIWLAADDVFRIFNKCPADLLLVSCACHINPHAENAAAIRRFEKTDSTASASITGDKGDAPASMPVTGPLNFEAQRVLKDEPARLYLGYPGVALEMSNAEGMTSLGLLVSQALLGGADQDVPQYFEPRFGSSFSHGGSPDGIVTLQELVNQIKRFAATSAEDPDGFVVRGQLGRGDVALTRSILPVD